jgi:hypothetical protein
MNCDIAANRPRGVTEAFAREHGSERDPQETPIDQHGLRCPGKHAMADAIMAITANLAMKHKKRIVFKEEWFDPENPAVPETDPEIVG